MSGEDAIAAFIRERGVTICPPACAAPTHALIDPKAVARRRMEIELDRILAQDRRFNRTVDGWGLVEWGPIDAQ